MLIPVIRNNANNWLYNAFNDLFGMDCVPATMNNTPAVNVKESDADFQMDIAVPGLKKEDCRLNINDEGDLVVKIERKLESQEGDEKQETAKSHYLRREFSYANYEQTFTLPENVDKEGISAKVSDGILSVIMPKVPEEPEKKLERPIEIG